MKATNGSWWLEQAATSDTLAFERSLWARGYRLVAGTDEAGRGPLAGPVVAACVVLPVDCRCLFQDSKQLSAKRRRELEAELDALPGAAVGVGMASVAEIDGLNILQASLLAMCKAVEALAAAPDFLLVDGKFTIPLELPQQALVKGDSRSASIAAASIVAKQRRDRLMAELHRQYPQYNFLQHKGYATAEHRRLLRRFGPCPEHRRSFKPVRELLAGWNGPAGVVGAEGVLP
ncbi:MAG: ribonuclease HII [Desulfurivibrio sp.]|nr:ribonuclease HII [Desulfurivibrio sp.]